eukprot:4761954-Pyramimonas_sp.AAC.1
MLVGLRAAITYRCDNALTNDPLNPGQPGNWQHERTNRKGKGNNTQRGSIASRLTTPRWARRPKQTTSGSSGHLAMSRASSTTSTTTPR